MNEKIALLRRYNFWSSDSIDLGYKRSTYVDNIVGYIEDAFLIHKCDHYNIKGKDIMSGNAKYYINDLAYKNYLYSGYGYGYGYLAEKGNILHSKLLTIILKKS